MRGRKVGIQKIVSIVLLLAWLFPLATPAFAKGEPIQPDRRPPSSQHRRVWQWVQNEEIRSLEPYKSKVIPLCHVQQINADQQELNTFAVNRENKALQIFLQNRGYRIVSDAILFSELSCEGKSSRIEVAIIPFVAPDAENVLGAHIALWNGVWETRPIKGAIAVIESSQEQIFISSRGRKVISVQRDKWRASLPLPLDLIPGLSLPQPLKSTEETVHVDNRLVGVSESVAVTSCKTVDVARVGYSLLGFVMYKFHQRKSWCYNGTTVFSISISAYVSDMDGVHYYRGIVSQWNRFSANHSSHDSMRQGRIDACIAGYCYDSDYPAVQIISYSDGSFYYISWD